MAKPKFNSNDYVFRPTSVGDALARAGMMGDLSLVRESKREGLLRAKHDRRNNQPSVHIPVLGAA